MENFTDIDIQNAYLSLVRDADFDRLELALNEPNIFSILSIEHMEIRHSNFLGWLLNPKENHGLNDLFLKRFLREILSDAKIPDTHALDAETLNFQKVEVLREWKDIDLLLKFPDLVICIENKVRSKDHSNQLKRYKQIIAEEFPDQHIRKGFIYLTPYGDISSEEQEYYAFISYQTVIDILDRILNVYKELISPQSTYYINDYIKSLKRNLMGTDKTNEIAKEIYRNHQKLLDFIFENKPDHLDDFYEIMESFLREKGYIIGSKNKGYIRFIKPEVMALVPKYKIANGWPNREAFLFEIEFRFLHRITFRALSTPAPTNTAYKNKLAGIIKNLGVARKITEKWQVFFLEDTAFDVEKAITEGEENAKAKLEKFWVKIYPIIQKVEDAMLAQKDELITLKQEVEE